MRTPVDDYNKMRDKLTKRYGDDLSKWKDEYKYFCKIKKDVNLALKVTEDKIEELTKIKK
jgi:hypothetical protein